YHDGALWLLDQTRLPHETLLHECRTHQQVSEAIRRLAVRGAPAIGLAAAYGVDLAARSIDPQTPSQAVVSQLHDAMTYLQSTRPTAVNLAWALDRLRALIATSAARGSELADALEAETGRMLEEDLRANMAMGEHGAELIPDGANVITHCNAG